MWLPRDEIVENRLAVLRHAKSGQAYLWVFCVLSAFDCLFATERLIDFTVLMDRFLLGPDFSLPCNKSVSDIQACHSIACGLRGFGMLSIANSFATSNVACTASMERKSVAILKQDATLLT